jgi:hypothetical protein
VPHPPTPARAAAVVATAAIASALLLASPSPVAHLAGGAIALLAGIVIGRRLLPGSTRSAQRTTTAEITAGTPMPAVAHAPPSELRRAIESRRREGTERRRAELLAQYLRDLRDACGAEEVVFWRLDPRTRALAPFAESTAAGSRDVAAGEAILPMVRWAADERIVHFDGSEDLPRFVVGPVADERRVHGALSLRATRGLGWPREKFKQWMPRHAAHLALLVDLLETREDVERQNVRMQALMRAAQSFQSNRTSESLGRAICDTALEVSSASRAGTRGRGGARCRASPTGTPSSPDATSITIRRSRRCVETAFRRCGRTRA